MARRPSLLVLAVLLLGLAASAGLYAQMESGERGILPLDSSGTLEITGIEVDVAGKDAASARYNGWRIAQRQGFKALWAKTHNRPVSQAPNLSDSALDNLVSSIIVEREQIGPNRYIAQLGILFDRARSAELLGVGGPVRRSLPMLLVPITVTAGSMTSVEWRNAWQRAWAEFRTERSPIDYVRVSGMGIDPLLVNAAQTRRPGRGWWRNIIDLYGASDILTAEVALHRLYPGGPAEARFVGRHGPDGDIIGGFSLRARDSADIPRMMREGAQRMDELFAAAHAAGQLQRDPTLIIPEPPEEEEEIVEDETTSYTVLIYSPDAVTYNYAFATLRVMPGIQQVSVRSINLGGISTVTATASDISAARAAMAARGWTVSVSGGVVRISNGPFPALAQPPAAPVPQPAQPTPAEPTGQVP